MAHLGTLAPKEQRLGGIYYLRKSSQVSWRVSHLLTLKRGGDGCLFRPLRYSLVGAEVVVIYYTTVINKNLSLQHQIFFENFPHDQSVPETYTFCYIYLLYRKLPLQGLIKVCIY